MNKESKKTRLMVTKPLLPPLEEFIPYLETIWSSGILTNNGEFIKQLEHELCNYLGVKYISIVSSGTMALTIALKSLRLKGEVITTPFTHAATSQAICWNNLTPVYADINTEDFNLDISAIERAITPTTSAILPVHVFGKPCDVVAIQKLAEKYNLRVIYDAAHCFGVQLNGESLCNSGDLSILSFHATKVFNCIEGGAIICHDEITKNNIDKLRNIGFNANQELVCTGTNAKMNELQAAFGLAQLKYADTAIENRKIASKRYRELLSDIKGISLHKEREDVTYNYSYFPILINSDKPEGTSEQLVRYLESNNIFPRRYFHPLLSDTCEFNVYKTTDYPNAKYVGDRIICLPLSHETSIGDVEKVVGLIYEFKRERSKVSYENVFIK